MMHLGSKVSLVIIVMLCFSGSISLAQSIDNSTQFNISVTSINDTSANITWQSDDNRYYQIYLRGFYNIYDRPIDPDKWIQGITYDLNNKNVKDSSIIAQDFKEIKEHNFTVVNMYGLDKVKASPNDESDLVESAFKHAEEQKLKLIVRLEYTPVGFNFSDHDIKQILAKYSRAIDFAKTYSNAVWCYNINMPLDDENVRKNMTGTPEENRIKQQKYLSNFSEELRNIDSAHRIYASTYYGWNFDGNNTPELNVAPIGERINGTILTVYPDCPVIDVNGKKELHPLNLNDTNEILIGVMELEANINKSYIENNISENRKMLIDNGFADSYVNKNQRNGRVADSKTKAKAINILRDHLMNDPRVNGWIYFMMYDNAAEASWGLVDTRIFDLKGPLNNISLDNLFPNTKYIISVKSENKILKEIRFNTSSSGFN